MAISINNNTGDIFAGGDQTDGDLVLQDTAGQNRIHLDAGGDATPEEISQTSIYLDGQNANLLVGGRRADGSQGEDGDILLFADNGDRTNIDAAIGIRFEF